MRIEAMLFHLTPEDHIRTSDEQRRTETDGGRSSFASEQELQELASQLIAEGSDDYAEHVPLQRHIERVPGQCNSPRHGRGSDTRNRPSKAGAGGSLPDPTQDSGWNARGHKTGD